MQSVRLVALLITAFCGGISSCGGSEPKRTPIVEVPTCQPLSTSGPRDFKVSWTAIKNGNSPVDGSIRGVGTLEPSSALVGTKVSLTFDPKSSNSGIELRDSRVASLFFENVLITFSGSVASSDTDSLPPPGEERRVTISGSLNMAKNPSAITVYAVLKNEGGSLTLYDDASRPSFVNARATPGLSSNVARLLSVAEVAGMDSNVLIKGSLPMTRVCD